MIIESLEDLKRYGRLKVGDTVYFHTRKKCLEYWVFPSFLSNREIGKPNIEIFSILGLGFDAEAICEEAYGYRSHGGGWPSWGDNDQMAATKIVKKLYRMLEIRTDLKVKIEKREISRFELIDLD